MNLRYRHLFFLFVALMLAPGAHAATLSAVPLSASVSVGDSVTVNVTVSSPGQALNAIAGTLSYPADLLSVASVSKANSVLTLWVQDPTFSNTTGTIDWSGVVPNPGFTGAGRVVSVRFVAKSTGVARISFSSSAVLANDGNGTNILTAANPASISITPASAKPPPAAASSQNPDLVAQITSSTHPDQTRWYPLTHVVFDWTNAVGVTAVRLGYDQNANGSPIVPYAEPISHKELDLENGVWYFHVQEKGPDGAWGPVSTFKVQVDTVSPKPFSITFLGGMTTEQSTLPIRFDTTDELSGIDHYVLSVDGADSIVSAGEGSDVYALPSGKPGPHMLRVTAHDKAGNAVSADGRFTMTGTEAPAFPSFAWLTANYLALGLLMLAAIFAALAASWYLWHRFCAFRRRVTGETYHMHKVLHQQFENLKGAVMDEISGLENVRTRRALTAEEERLMHHLQQLIDDAEHIIEKEVDAELRARRRDIG